jgi:hypothetical protein
MFCWDVAAVVVLAFAQAQHLYNDKRPRIATFSQGV